MLRDRFRAWNLKPKYNKLKTRRATGCSADEQSEDDVQHPNGLAVLHPENAHVADETAALAGLFSGRPGRLIASIAGALNRDPIRISGEFLCHSRECAAPYIIPDTARTLINTVASTSDPTTSGTLHPTQPFANQPSDLENGNYGTLTTTYFNGRPIQDAIGGDSYYAGVRDGLFHTSVPPSNFQRLVDRPPPVDGYGSLWWYSQGPIMSGNAESFINLPPEELINGNEEIIDFVLAGPSRPPNTATEDRL